MRPTETTEEIETELKALRATAKILHAKREELAGTPAAAETIAQQQKYFRVRTEAFAETVPDFKETVENSKLKPLSSTVAELVVNSENGPALLYYLVKNADVAVRLSGMDPVAAAAALGRVEASITSRSRTVPNEGVKRDDATPRGGRANSPPRTSGKLSMDEFARQHFEERAPRRPQPYVEMSNQELRLQRQRKLLQGRR